MTLAKSHFLFRRGLAKHFKKPVKGIIMLDFMRKQAKSWMMKVILGLIIVVFIFYFGTTRGGKEMQAVAKVGDRTITYADYNRKYYDLLEGYRRYLGGSLPEEFLKGMNLKQQALDLLINEAVVLNRASDLGISASDDEIRGSIMFYPAFQRNGVFDQRVYNQVLRQLKMTPEDFEKSQKSNIVVSKIESLIKEGAQTSDQELYDMYAMQSDQIDLEFMRISPKDFTGRVHPSDADLEKYLKDNGDAFRIPEKIQARYLSFGADNFDGSVRVSDEDINEYYSFHKAEYEKAGEKTLTPARKEKIAAEVKKTKALDIASQAVKKARDTIYQYDNLDEYAKKINLPVRSTDYFTVSKPPAELAQIKDIQKYLADLKKGDLSPILSTPTGFYLLKITDVKAAYVPSLKEAREEVARKYAEKEARVLAGKEADSALSDLKKGEDFKKVAQSKGLKIADTGRFVPGTSVPKIGTSKDMSLALIELASKKPYPDKPFLVDGDYFVVKLKDKLPADKKDFEAKKDQIRMGYLRMKETLYLQSWLNEQKDALTKKGEMKILKKASEL